METWSARRNRREILARSGSSAGDLRALEAMLGGVDESLAEGLKGRVGKNLEEGRAPDSGRKQE
jgi:hypothetical protein